MENEPKNNKTDPDKIIGKLFSIPATPTDRENSEKDAYFDLDLEKSPDEINRCFYKIDSSGNVYLINKDNINKAVNQYDLYLKQAFNIENIINVDTCNGVIVKRLPKIDIKNGKITERGLLEFVKEKKLEYNLNNETINIEKENTLEKPKIFYAECPNEKDGSFNIDENSEMEIPDISVFKFTQTGPDTAEFELINNPNVRQRAIKLYYTVLQPVTENKAGYDQHATPADLIFERAKGTVRKEGNKWILVDKLIIKKMGKNSNPWPQEKIVPEVSNVTESVVEAKDVQLEKQKKINDIERRRQEELNGVDHDIVLSAIDAPINSIYFSGKNNDKLTDRIVNREEAKFAIYNIKGDSAEIATVGRGANENYYDKFATFKGLEFDHGDIFTLQAGTVKKINGEWIINKTMTLSVGEKTYIIKASGNKFQLDQINAKYDAELAELEKDINTVQKETNNPVPTIKEESKDEHNKDLEKQKKIDEIYSEIMEMINRNTESLLKEKKLEDELTQLIASGTKKEMVNEPAKKIEVKPFSFNIEFIKNKIQEIIASAKEIKKIEGFSIIPGPNNEFILNVKKITAEFKFFFTFTTDITIKNAHIMNFGDGIKLNDNYEITATDYENKVKDKMAKNIDKISDAIKEIVEKEVGKKVEKIWIENGELKAL